MTSSDPNDVFGPVVHPVVAAEPVPRGLRQTARQSLAEIQAELREETARRSRGEFRGGQRRQV